MSKIVNNKKTYHFRFESHSIMFSLFLETKPTKE